MRNVKFWSDKWFCNLECKWQLVFFFPAQMCPTAHVMGRPQIVNSGLWLGIVATLDGLDDRFTPTICDRRRKNYTSAECPQRHDSSSRYGVRCFHFYSRLCEFSSGDELSFKDWPEGFYSLFYHLSLRSFSKDLVDETKALLRNLRRLSISNFVWRLVFDVLVALWVASWSVSCGLFLCCVLHLLTLFFFFWKDLHQKTYAVLQYLYKFSYYVLPMPGPSCSSTSPYRSCFQGFEKPALISSWSLRPQGAQRTLPSETISTIPHTVQLL